MIRNLFFAWLLLVMPALCEGAPKVFQSLDFATASGRAKEQGRWLLVDATAVWCGPCHKMDATTWADPAVEAYLEKNALAIQVDVDEMAELTKKLGIKAMPTVIVFGPDGELDRSVGYKTAEELLAWLNDLREGRTQADGLREKAATGDIESRYDLAGQLLASGKYSEAEPLYLDLWEKMRGTEWSAVRCSYMLSSLADLAENSPSAKEQLERFRREAFAKGDFSDWFYLSKTLGHDDELLAWEPAKEAIPRIEDFYFKYLIEHDQLAKAGSLLTDPAGEARDNLKLRASLIEGFPEGDEMREGMMKYAQDSTRKGMLSLYAACMAAGRNEQAQEVRRIATEDDPSLKVDFEALDTQTKPVE